MCVCVCANSRVAISIAETSLEQQGAYTPSPIISTSREVSSGFNISSDVSPSFGGPNRVSTLNSSCINYKYTIRSCIELMHMSVSLCI